MAKFLRTPILKNTVSANGCFFIYKTIKTIEFVVALFAIEVLRGYLRYKTTTSQNVSSEAQVKNFFFR